MRVTAYHGGDAGGGAGIEHTCLKQVIFDKKMDVAAAAGGIVDIVFNGVKQHG